MLSLSPKTTIKYQHFRSTIPNKKASESKSRNKIHIKWQLSTKILIKPTIYNTVNYSKDGM